MDTHHDEYEVIGDKVVDTTADENTRNYAQWIHLAGLIGGIAAVLSAGISLPVALLAVLVLWLMKRDQSPFIDDHGKEAVNFQISILIYALLVLPAATLITCGLGILLAVPIAILDVVGTISGSKAAQRGEYYRYPACIRLLQ
jgi:uncharacterized protein